MQRKEEDTIGEETNRNSRRMEMTHKESNTRDLALTGHLLGYDADLVRKQGCFFHRVS